MARPPTSRAWSNRRVVVVQPVEQAFHRVAQHLGHAADCRRGAVAMAAHGGAVEHPHLAGQFIVPMCTRSAALPSAPATCSRVGTWKRINAATLRGWITDGDELALLDAREEGEFRRLASVPGRSPARFRRSRYRARALLPRRATRIVCTDDGRGLAERLATWLEADSCTDVAVLDGGTKAWAASGLRAVQRRQRAI